jgi:hypothetical protein
MIQNTQDVTLVSLGLHLAAVAAHPRGGVHRALGVVFGVRRAVTAARRREADVR